MWLKEDRLKELISTTMKEFMQESGMNVDACIKGLKECFKIDNKGNIQVSNSTLNVNIGSTVVGADQAEIQKLAALVSGLYDVLGKQGNEVLRELIVLDTGVEAVGEELTQMRTELLDSVHSVLEFQESALKDVKKELTSSFAEHDRKMLLNARTHLYQIMYEMWSGKKDPRYYKTSYDYASQIAKYGTDFIAEFGKIFFAPAFNSDTLAEFLKKHASDRALSQEEVLFVLRTMLLNYDTKYDMDPWLKACRDESLRDFFSQRYREEAAKFADGTYDPAISRDVFIAYNHENEDLAKALVVALEDPKNYGFTCFFSCRNLRISATYDRDLETAMNHCKVFVFVSTPESRAPGSYTHTEMNYIMSCDLRRKKLAPNDPYEMVDRKYRTPRVEYLPDRTDYDKTQGYGKEVGQFFAGLQYFSDIAAVCERVYAIVRKNQWKNENLRSDESAALPAEVRSTPAPAPERKKVKYCVECLAECAEEDLFCGKCGGKRFRAKKDAKYCVSCEKEVSRDVKFCTSCRSALFAETPEEAHERRLAAEKEARLEAARKAAAEAARKESERKAKEEEERKAAEAERVRRLSTLVRRSGKRVLFFGSYPQTKVTDFSVIAALNAAAGALPTKKNAAKWTSYKYFIKGENDKDFMWYIDLEYSGEKYRGVYFTSYRPYDTTDSSSENQSYQDDNGYATGNVYWFKYEPIKWRVLSEANGEALILSEMIIDSQEYCSAGNGSSFSHNGGRGYANNYALSDIRKWLNDTFYNTAFTDLEKQRIVLTTVDNSARSTNPDNNATEWNSGNNKYACANTQDYVFLLSEQEVTNSAYGFNSDCSNYDTSRRKKNTDYAKSQGVWINANSGYWWLRSPDCRVSCFALGVSDDGRACDSIIVSNTDYGVVPALRIRTGTATKEDNGPIQEGNDAKARSLKREIGVSKGIETGGVKAGEDAHRGDKQRRRGNKIIVLVPIILAILVIISIVWVSITIASLKGSAGSEGGDELYFGSYPQTEVTDSSLISALTTAAGTLPTSSNSQKWTSYGYYAGGSVSNYMWYIDVEQGGEKYRGVYFTSYRPDSTSFGSSADNSYQDDNGYTTGNVYWFKYEPIKWRVLSEANGEALILSEMIIDSQEYYPSSSSSSFSHNGGTGYANNYALSSIRKWLNDTFYHTAFTDLEKQRIVLTTVDNSARSTNPNNDATWWSGGNNPYACANTQDHVFLLSEQEVTNSAYGFNSTYSNDDTARRKKNTDYAKSQGVETSTPSSYAGNRYWWLRSPHYYVCNDARVVTYSGYGDSIYHVYRSDIGVVPALKIKLD